MMLQGIARASRLVLIACIGVLAAGAVGAQQATADAHWMCWYNHDTTVRCLLREAASDADWAERQVKIAQAVPGSRPLPRNVRRIIRAEAELLGVEVLVPLFSEPEDPLFVEQLANFTMCYGRLGCRVTFLDQRLELALAR